MSASLASQIAAVKREIALRNRVYPRLVASGKLRQREAELQGEHMLAVLKTLEWLQTHEAEVRAFVATARGDGA